MTRHTLGFYVFILAFVTVASSELAGRKLPPGPSCGVIVLSGIMGVRRDRMVERG